MDCCYLPDRDRRPCARSRMVTDDPDDLDAEICEPLDESSDLVVPPVQVEVDILAGSPFMVHNDIGVRPAKRQIQIGGIEIIRYSSPSRHTRQSNVRHTQSFLLRNPNRTVVLPGEYVQFSTPSDSDSDTLWALDPRLDSPSSMPRKPEKAWPPPQQMKSVDHAVRVSNTTGSPILLKSGKQLCQPRQILPVESSTSPPPTCGAVSPSPVTRRPFSPLVSLDPDGCLDQDTRDKFIALNLEFDDVFNPSISKYNGASGKIEAVVNIGPSLPPQRKGRLPQYNKNSLEELQNKFDDLEAAGVFAKPEQVNVNVEYLKTSFLEKKPSGGKWKYIVITDLLKSFYQIPPANSSMKYCGVATPFKGIRVCTRSAMGMPGSETSLEELMSRVLGDLIQEGCVAKIADDLFNGSLFLAGFLSAKLRKHQVTWLLCEIEALAIGAAIRHFAPYIIQSHIQQIRQHVLTDSRPYVQAYEKLKRGEFSASSRVTTFLSTASRYSVHIRHIAGVENLPSDYAIRNPKECSDCSCQICKFIIEFEDSVVRSLSVSDVLQGSVKMHFASRAAWQATQWECPHLWRTHSRSVLKGLLTALHTRFSHPSKYKTKRLFTRYPFALDVDKAIDLVSSSCHIFESVKSIPKQFQPQSSKEPSQTIGVSFAADVARSHRQLILVQRETVSSYTLTTLIKSKKHEDLRNALVILYSQLRSLHDGGATIRVDPATRFCALTTDPILLSQGITLEIGRVKNLNKNPVAERAIEAIGLEVLNLFPEGRPVSDVTLALATANMNSCILHDGLLASEVCTQRDQLTVAPTVLAQSPRGPICGLHKTLPYDSDDDSDPVALPPRHSTVHAPSLVVPQPPAYEQPTVQQPLYDIVPVQVSVPAQDLPPVPAAIVPSTCSPAPSPDFSAPSDTPPESAAVAPPRRSCRQRSAPFWQNQD
ncbi:hypothetical protein AWC38_SpisGene17719 [Stylophora pistillata]|uniref:Uncharacterized protein n=1 Tax=Stylophora pistillata TaxID=50429 RepID=A0A2B4RHS7_STYPI|nr:hypothetical protein AWC38_SpisGene17719 [Stylophora pistillata]